MFNFSRLKLIKDYDYQNYNPFVGIRRNNKGEFEFRLPLGFTEFPDNSFDHTKKIFFSMYKTFKKFENEHKDDFLDQTPKSKDNTQTSDGAYKFKDQNDEEVLLYSKIRVIDTILTEYEDLALNTVTRTEGKSENIDFNKIDKYLDQAIYLEDNQGNQITYIEDYNTFRSTLDYTIHSIIELFCFILCELKYELNEEVSIEVRNYHAKFKDTYLGYDDSLFKEDSFEHTISILKDILDKIDHLTAYKDEDYWHLYKAIEIFLYGELDTNQSSDDGIFWGINNFYQIWEDMCNTYSFKNFNEIIYADTNIKLKNKTVANKTIASKRLFCQENFNPPFYFQLKNNLRYGRPDLIYKVNIGVDYAIDFYHRNDTLVDVRINLIENKSKKIYDSIIKKMCNAVNKTHGRFIKPNIFKVFSKKTLNEIFKEYKIITILDWKYINKDIFLDYDNKKINQDISKQLFYEYALKNYFSDYTIISQFVIPYYYDSSYDDIGEFLSEKNINPKLISANIAVFQANFYKIQEAYLNND